MKAQDLVSEQVPQSSRRRCALLTISASRSEQMYHTDLFSLSGCRSVFSATRRRSSQALGPLVAVIRRLVTVEKVSIRL